MGAHTGPTSHWVEACGSRLTKALWGHTLDQYYTEDNSSTGTGRWGTVGQATEWLAKSIYAPKTGFHPAHSQQSATSMKTVLKPLPA